MVYFVLIILVYSYVDINATGFSVKTNRMNSRKFLIVRAFLLLACLLLLPVDAKASPFDSILNRNGILDKVDSSADTYEYVGDNVIANGHVVIRFGNMLLTADKAIFNLGAQDVELSGHVSFSERVTFNQVLTPSQYEEAIRDPYQITKRLQTFTTEIGAKMISVSVTKNKRFMNADRAFLNLRSGTIHFRDFMLKEGIVYISGARAERRFDGTITVRDVRFTTCNYMVDGHDHYAVTAKKAVVTPPKAKSGLFNYGADISDVSILTKNSFLEFWGTPVLWLPMLYKPPEEGGFGGLIELGNRTRWGYFMRASKNFRLLDEPYLNSNLMLDGYTKRGIGYGINFDLMTAESATDLFFYGIYDMSPYEYWANNDYDNMEWKKNNSRLTIPNYRYEFRIANLTHISPRTDFRGQLDLLSDYNFLNDYFYSRYAEVLEPPTFVSLEKQFDRMTASLYLPFRVNSFFTTLERLPELRLDFQRQELFKNLYYQGETSMGYYQMKWRQFDRPRTYGDMLENQDYGAFRFDSLHMFYFPLKFANINFIPRAGFRLTAYSKSSKNPITSQDLNNMFAVDSVDGQPVVDGLKHYDSQGGSVFRFIGEIGLEVNAKFYRSWQNVKSEYFGLNGLRHVIIPYLNYTFIPKPTESPDHLYYFDEVDRIDETHFIRLGLINRLQTRRNNQVHEWFSMENYWDYFFHTTDEFSHVGDFGTILKFRPTEKLLISTELLLDVGGSNAHDTEVYQGTENVGRPGMSNKLFNQWNLNLAWNFAPDWVVTFGYTYSDDYVQRTAYSMGSTISNVNANSLFFKRYSRGQYISGG